MDVVRQSVYVNHALKPLAGNDPPPTPIPYPDTGTGESLRNVARMLGAGLGIRVATVQAGGALRQPREPDRRRTGRTSPTWATRCSRSSATSRPAAWPTAC